MSFSRFFGFGLLLWLLLSLLKAFFLDTLNLDSFTLQVLFGFLVFVISMACARRLGVINYLEAIMVAVAWVIGLLFLDFVILRAVLGWSVFTRGLFWSGYLVAGAAIFLFHKKRHVQVRRELAAHHHGHRDNHGGEHKQHGDQEPGKHH